MAINPALLIAAPMMVNYFVDKFTGEPLSGGLIKMYKNSDQQVFKNWYYQANQGGEYVFLPLPNPLRLSAVGTIVDIGGNVLIPYYYPYSEDPEEEGVVETYFVQIFSRDGLLQNTLENFPPLNGNSNIRNVPAQKNYIINNRFWRNIGSIDLTNETQVVVCPSQHDGFRFPDIQFFKDVAGSEDSLVFTKFNPGEVNFNNAVPPEWYLHPKCSSATTGENYKYYQFPLSLHIQTLESQQATITFFAANLSPVSAARITVSLLQDLGSNASNTITTAIPLQTYNLTSNWTQYTYSFTFPSAVGKTVSPTEDDGLYLQFNMPLDAEYELGIALPSQLLGTELVSNDFSTYDQIDAVIGTNRTYDIRISGNPYLFGWVLADDGSIGSSESAATNRRNADTWQLYNIIWNTVSDFYAPVSTGRGSSAYADFTDNKPISLTKALGRVLSGAASTPSLFPVNFTVSGSKLTLTSSKNITTGMPVLVTNTGGSLPSGLTENTIYYICSLDLTDTECYLSDNYTNAIAGTYITLLSTGTGTQSMISSIGSFQGASYTTDVASHAHGLSELTEVWHDGTPPNETVSAPGGVDLKYLGAVNTDLAGVDEVSIMQPSVNYNVFFKL